METREEYVQRLKSQLDQWNAEVTRWETKTHEANADMRQQYERQLEEFRRHRDRTVEQLRQMQTANADAWVQLMRSTDDAWARTREAFEKAYTQFGR